MKKTEKVVIRISGEWSAKNQLHKLIRENLSPLNHGLVPDIETARDLIHDAVNISHVQCKTKCTPVKLEKPRTYEQYGVKEKDNEENWQIESLISIQIMKLQIL